MTSLLGLSPEEIQELIHLKEKFRSKQIYHAIYSGIESFDAITDLPLSLRQSLAENFCIFTSKVDTSLDDEGGNCKLRIELSDGLFTECVILSDGTDRKTICISSQVGCKMGCAFCRTADMGFKRNLTAGEILEQYLIGSRIAGKLSNIVFMGMGEPFDNIDNLKKAITILNDKNAIGLGARRMTISTCGVVPGIQALAQSKLEIRLAVSLNSAIEEKRRQIMPITARYPLAQLKEALKAFVGNPSALLLMAGLGMMIYVDVGFKTWMPSHIETGFGMSKGSAALNAVLWHYLGAFVGVTLGGRISDRLVKRRPSVRMETNIAGLALAVPFIVWMAYAPSLLACGIAMALFGVFRGVYDSNLMASLFDIIPQRYHASGAGLMLSGAFVFGSTAPVVLGLVKDAFSSTAALASLAAFYLAGAAIIFFARLRQYAKGDKA